MAGLAKRKIRTVGAIKRQSWESTPQGQRSAQSRLQLTEGVVRCLLKFGYANTTTTRVAAEAGLSRGAMMHHFESGPALIRATIEHLHEKRLRAFRRTVTSHPDPDDIRGLIMGYWHQITNPTFIAFQELAIAARTDPDLAEILQPGQREFNEQWYQLAIDLFPAWQKDRKRFDLALSLSRYTIEGLAINHLLYRVEESTITQVLNHLEQEIRSLRPSDDALPQEINCPPP